MKIPVTVLTGFLGAGKTTLLNRLLRHPEMAATAVLVNEYGEVGLDHLLIERLDGDTVLLEAGCICCTVREDLVRALLNMAQRAEAGQEIRRVVIETTGLADPAPILQTLIAHPFLVAAFALDGVVTLVDARAGDMALDTQAEAVKQVAMADRLVLTKTDLVPADEVARLEARLSVLNPMAPPMHAVDGDIAPAALLGAGPFSLDGRIPAVAAWLASAARDSGETPAFHGRSDGIETCTLTFDAPLPWEGLATWLEMFAMTRGESLLRVKGVLDIAGEERPVIIHGVQRSFHPPARLGAWPEGHDRRSRLVFVTRNVPRGVIEESLNAFLDAAR